MATVRVSVILHRALTSCNIPSHVDGPLLLTVNALTGQDLHLGLLLLVKGLLLLTLLLRRVVLFHELVDLVEELQLLLGRGLFEELFTTLQELSIAPISNDSGQSSFSPLTSLGPVPSP